MTLRFPLVRHSPRAGSSGAMTPASATPVITDGVVNVAVTDIRGRRPVVSGRRDRRWTLWLAGAWGAALVLLGALPLAARLTDRPVSLFTRDVFSIAEIPVYSALLSNLGAFLWCAAATLCLFTATSIAVGRGPRLFFAGFGVLSLMFLVDDFFMLHEWIVPSLLGLPQATMAGLYAVLGGGLLVATRREVLAREPCLLAVAVTMFAASLAAEEVQRVPTEAWHYLAEEGFKFLGIVAWCLYFARASVRELRIGSG